MDVKKTQDAIREVLTKSRRKATELSKRSYNHFLESEMENRKRHR